MLLVQEFLLTHSFKELQEQHGVYASFSKSGHKFSLNYDQIEAKEADPLAQECRGLILATKDGAPLSKDPINIPGETVVLAFPMKRFFNYGQGAAANVNWSDPNLAVLEKLDGTLCILYFDRFTLQWCVATRSVPEADLLMDNGIFTFRTLFEKALKDTCGLSFEEFTSGLDSIPNGRKMTYCFELTTPYNRIVVNYTDCRITLLSIRKLFENYSEIHLGEYITYSYLGKKLDLGGFMGIPPVERHIYNSTQDLLDWVSTLNPMEHEGVVVVDSNFNRIKVKNAAYVAYNKLHDRLGSSERNCMEFILLEKDDDVKSFLPEEIVKNMETLKQGLQNALSKHEAVYSLIDLNMKALGDSATQKDFALMVNRHKELWSAPFFQIRAGKASSMKDFIQKNRKDGTWGDSFLDKILELAKKNV